jgi:hypothetical protein
MYPSLYISIKLKKAMRILLLTAFIVSACQPSADDDSMDSFSGEIALKHVEQQLEFGPRYPGTSGHESIQEWLVEELTQLEWVVERQTFDYMGAQLVNIIACHPENVGSAPIILGAHYDTRRFANRDQHDPSVAVPGANDGASGVAVLLELARVFTKSSPTDLMIVFFDAEDQGRIEEWDWDVGSRYFVEHLDQEPRAVVIVDMVGDKDLRLPFERSSDPELVASIWATAERLGYQEFVGEPGSSIIDDHIPFIQRGIPAILVIDFTYPYWHTAADQIDKVSAGSLHKVGTTLEAWLKNLNQEFGEATQ